MKGAMRGLSHYPVPTVGQLKVVNASQVSSHYTYSGVDRGESYSITKFRGKSLKGTMSVEVEKCWGPNKDNYQMVRLGSFQIEGDPNSATNQKYIAKIERQLKYYEGIGGIIRRSSSQKRLVDILNTLLESNNYKTVRSVLPLA